MFNLGTYDHLKESSASWRIVIGLGWIFTIGLGFGILTFSETPRFAYRQGRVDEARETLMRVYDAPANHWAIHSQMEEIESKLRAESHVKTSFVGGYIEMFGAPRMAYRIALGVALQMFQQLTGANYFFYYATTVFQSVQISSFITQVILNTINFAVTFIGLYLVEHYGRRKSLLVGSVWMFICFLIFASVGHFLLDIITPSNTPTAGIVLIVFAALFVLGYATTWGPMVWTLIAEIYPSVRIESSISHCRRSRLSYVPPTPPIITQVYSLSRDFSNTPILIEIPRTSYGASYCEQLDLEFFDRFLHALYHTRHRLPIWLRVCGHKCRGWYHCLLLLHGRPRPYYRGN